MASPPGKQLKVEDALAYLDKVKRQFRERPEIYNQFLEIMKNFKAQMIDTPGVIHRVSELFRGHNNLILGFNTFLPPGYRIEVVDQQGNTHISRPGQPRPVNAATLQPMSTRPGLVPPQLPRAAPAPQHSPENVPGAPVAPAAAPPQVMPQHLGVVGGQTSNGHQPAQDTQDQGQPPEFDHAITYVTKIKKRFQREPAIYRQFLEILHSYQKRQESIKDVLDKVTVLFHDHPDLLEDFTYFLPDTVQNQARERLARAADNAYRKAGRIPPRDRLRARENARMAAKDQYEAYTDARVRTGREWDRQLEIGRHYERERDRYSIGMGPGRSPMGREEERRRRAQEETLHLALPPTEREFFARLKAALGAQDLWIDFLKCLELYASDIFTQEDLMQVIPDIMGDRNAGLVEELQILMNSRGGIELTQEDVWYSMAISDIDFSGCESCTPSYRRLPEKYPRQASSERADWEQLVLNDDWVSVPTGSEDFSFKHMRRNQYEEALFRCEDERYEVDMVIDNNSSAIRVLEPLAEEIAALTGIDGYQWQFRLDRRSLGVIHLKAIARIYGEHGNEILELLRKNPAGAIPIILSRLKEKDGEWRRARVELNKSWKEVQEKNYAKSLDHRSFYFKSADKKLIGIKALVGDLKKKLEEGEAEIASVQRARAGEPALALPSSATRDGDEEGVDKDRLYEGSTGQVVWKDGVPLLQPVLHYMYRDTSVHRDVAEVLSYAIERHGTEANKERLAALWRSFLFKFFQFRPEWMRPAAGMGAASESHALLIGTAVHTSYGDGVIENVVYVDDSDSASVVSDNEDIEMNGVKSSTPSSTPKPLKYVVRLDYGVAYLGESNVHMIDEAGSCMNLSGGVGTNSGSLQAKGGGLLNPANSNKLPHLAGSVKPVSIAANSSQDATMASSTASLIDSGRLAAPTPRLIALAASQLFSTKEARARCADEGVAEAVERAAKNTSLPPPGSLCFCSTSDYAFLRLHQMMADRLARAKQLCEHIVQHSRTETVRHLEDRAIEASRARNGKTTDNDVDMNSSTTASDSRVNGEQSKSNDAKAAELYHNYLTALCALIENKIDSNKYEDECRSLMGSGSYFLFTMDKLATACAKQMAGMVSDSTSCKLRSLYEYYLARIQLATARLAPDEARAEITTALRTYNSNIAAIISARSDDVYAVQYVEEDEAVVSAAAKAAAIPEPQHAVASLTFRLIGKPSYDVSEATLQHIDIDVPIAVSRLVGEGVVLQLRSSIEDGEYAMMQKADNSAADAQLKAKVIMGRNLREGSKGVNPDQDLHERGVTHSVGREGNLIPRPGGTDVLVRTSHAVHLNPSAPETTTMTITTLADARENTKDTDVTTESSQADGAAPVEAKATSTSEDVDTDMH